METRAGTSVLLSLCIVALAAVALYRPDPPRSPTVATSGPVIADESAEAVAVEDNAPDLPEPTAGIPLPPTIPTTAHAAAVPSPNPPTRPTTGVKPDSLARRRPVSAFTTVGVGETLAAIATRVYGTPEATDTLFRANRDVLSGPDDPLQVGGMLRTP